MRYGVPFERPVVGFVAPVVAPLDPLTEKRMKEMVGAVLVGVEEEKKKRPKRKKKAQ